MKYWITQKGDKIAIANMSKNHLKNTIAFLKRNMPGQEEDEIVTADHWSLLGVVTIRGSNYYRAVIRKMEAELNKPTPFE